MLDWLEFQRKAPSVWLKNGNFSKRKTLKRFTPEMINWQENSMYDPWKIFAMEVWKGSFYSLSKFVIFQTLRTLLAFFFLLLIFRLFNRPDYNRMRPFNSNRQYGEVFRIVHSLAFVFVFRLLLNSAIDRFSWNM